jgi:asparagine synthase (glutamine-hydrolysing)
MHSRGPDGVGLWIAENRKIALAHRRLAIIDLSDVGAQPMLDPGTGNRIVFNGEIYNYKALRAELERVGERFRSHSDTEVLLKLYAVHGPDMLSRLRGMYAFAIWDQNKQAAFLARDPLGIKPLYLSDDGKTLRFASQVKALLAGGAVDTSPEPAGHVGFFLWGAVPEPYTLYKGIRALPAGHSLWIERGGARRQRPFFNLAQGKRSFPYLKIQEYD